MQINELDLTVSGLSLGTHQIPWDLKILLHHGAASIPRKEAMRAMSIGTLAPLHPGRSLLVCAYHEAIKTQIIKGCSRALIITNLEVLWRFYAWADKNYEVVTHDNVIDIVKAWAEHQIQRSQIKKDITPMHGYRQVTKITSLTAGALKLTGAKAGTYLLYQTRMRKPNVKKKVLSTRADKQNLEKTFEFGYALKKICDTLDISTVRGTLPISIQISSNKVMILSGSLQDPCMDLTAVKDNTVRRNSARARAAMAHYESLLTGYKRSGIINLRIESEFLIFIAQTGMNAAQAKNIPREHYRWQSDGDELEAFRVYKGRRSGDAVFRCFRLYLVHFQRYLKWLEETELSEYDSRLFPFQNRAIIPASDSKVRLYTSKRAFKEINMPFFGPQELRKTRVNWLLRRSRDLDLTAEQMAHDKEVLLRDYERPHHQTSAIEIVSFHKEAMPAFLAPGPGVCIDSRHQPQVVIGTQDSAPKPDCISPEGCLFCSHHKDIMSADYCWKLMSHAKLKSLEIKLNKSSEGNGFHPASYVIEHINQKLNVISQKSKLHLGWIKDAQDLIRAGRYHPYWTGHIQLLEGIV